MYGPNPLSSIITTTFFPVLLSLMLKVLFFSEFVYIFATDELIFTMLTVPIPQSAIVQTRSSDVICFVSFLYIINITTIITATTIKLTIISLADMLMVFVSAVYCKDEFNIPEFLPKNI